MRYNPAVGLTFGGAISTREFVRTHIASHLYRHVRGFASSALPKVLVILFLLVFVNSDMSRAKVSRLYPGPFEQAVDVGNQLTLSSVSRLLYFPNRAFQGEMGEFHLKYSMTCWILFIIFLGLVTLLVTILFATRDPPFRGYINEFMSRIIIGPE